jgi:hypothetical protein
MPLIWVNIVSKSYHECGYDHFWKPGCYLSIYIETTTKEFVIFFLNFSLSTESLEDKQRFKLGGVDTSPTYLLFQTLLPLFWPLICMIWIELTRTDDVFSWIAMVSFLCRNKSSQNWTKLSGEFLYNIKKYWNGDPPEGGHPRPTRHQGASQVPGAPWWLVGPSWLRRP